MNLKLYVALWLLALGIATPAMALNQDITAVFRPNPAQPQQNKFVNTTPVSGYCASYPSQCVGTFSIRLPLRFDSVRPMQPDPVPRNNAVISVPAQWRTLSVTHTATGDVEPVEIRVVGIGSQYVLSDTAQNLTGAPDLVAGHYLLWGNSWVYAPAPCGYSGVGLVGNTSYGFFWRTPVQGACVKFTRFAIPAMSYSYLDFAYELRTPNPLRMSAGTYTGNLTYRVGPGGDFDMGDVMLPNDTEINLNFTLDVDHILKVEVPPGGDRVELLPQGGWQAWLQQGRKPSRLFRDQTFNLYASSRFKMQLECERVMGDTCALRNNANGHEVPVDIRVSLPPGLNNLDGSGVNRQPLSLSGTGSQLFQPVMYVDRKPGTLHFEVKQQAVAEMLDQDAGTYSGAVTVIWDSEV